MKGAEKIEKLLSHFSLNPTDFAKAIGKKVQNVYDIQKKVDISRNMADAITVAFPEVNKNWLLTGEGEMLKSTISQNNVEGDNIQGNNFTVQKSQVDELIDLLKIKEKQLIKSQENLTKSQEQTARLIGIIEQLNNK
jgi:plasmid maintenance system antidote protein VapI